MTISLNRRETLAALGALSLAGCSTSPLKFDAQIIVIGAGLSGLYAAMLLEEEGKDVLVVEAANRVGGRMFTLDQPEGFTEGGGQQIGASYARILDTAARLNVPLYEEKGAGPRTDYYLNGEWKSAQDLEIKDFPKKFQRTPPTSLLFRLLAQDQGFETSDAWQNAPESMDISAAEYLSQKGFSSAGQSLINRALNANDLESYSILNLHRSLQLFRQSASMGSSQYVEGGSQRLPEAMAASLSKPVRLNSFINAISQKEGYVEVSVEGQSQLLIAEHVICTIPFAVLRQIKSLNAPLNAAQKQAIQRLPYTQILQMHGRVSGNYWETDGLAPSMWLDNDLERIFAGTDKNSEFTGFIRTWVNGNGTKAWLSEDQKNTLEQALNRIADVRPALAKVLDLRNLVDWTTRNRLAGGAYMHWAPGQAKLWAEDMRKSAGRVHFAGEHLSLMHTGMEGAMESAERAAFDLLAV